MIADLVVISLAVFLITKVLFETTGPFDFFSRFRDYMSKSSRTATKFMACLWCQVTIFSLIIIPVMLAHGYDAMAAIGLCFATAGLAGIMRFLTLNRYGGQ